MDKKYYNNCSMQMFSRGDSIAEIRQYGCEPPKNEIVFSKLVLKCHEGRRLKRVIDDFRRRMQDDRGFSEVTILIALACASAMLVIGGGLPVNF